jgi:hypothetical protein
VALSNATTVSRWLVTPTATTRAGVPAAAAEARAPAAQVATVSAIWTGSCSTQL